MSIKEDLPWQRIYKEKGEVQAEAILAVIKLAEILEAENLYNPRVLDAACGTGRNSLYMAQRLDKGEYVGFDIASQALEIFQREWDDKIKRKTSINLHCLDMDGEITPPIYKSFDVIISSLAIHHGYTEDVRKRSSVLDDLLRSRGYLVLCVPSTNDPLFKTGFEVEPGTRLNTAQSDGSLPHHYFTLDEIGCLLPNYDILFAEETNPPLVISNIPGTASKLELVLQKK